MIDIIAANPPDVMHPVANIREGISNAKIIHLLEDCIINDPRNFGKLIELNYKAEMLMPGQFHHVAKIYGDDLHIDHKGVFHMGNIDDLKTQWEKERAAQDLIEKKQRDLAKSPHCQHKKFVGREVIGKNKFVCKECGERFKRHPSLPPEDRAAESPFNLTYLLSQFRDGVLTFSQTVKETGMAAEELKKALKEMFPPQPIYEDLVYLSSTKTARVCVDEEPVRTSDPELLEKTMNNQSNKDSIYELFPDMLSIERRYEIVSDKTIYLFHFIDGSIQRVEV